MSLIGKYGYPVIDLAGRTVLRTEAGLYQDAMELLQVRAAQDFLNIWARIPEDLPHRERVARLAEALTDLQELYGQDAASIAAEYLNVLRDGQDLPLVLADPVKNDRITSSVNYLLTKPEAKLLLWKTMQRYVMEPFRETVRLSAFAAGNGFARVPNADACPFCLMLASRGAVYYSKEDALIAGRGKYSRSKRGRNPHTRMINPKTGRKTGNDNRYHNDCKCSVVEVSATSGLPEANQMLFDMWQRTFYGDNHINPDATSIYGEDAFNEKARQANRRLPAVTFNNALPIWEDALQKQPLPWMSASQPRR